LGGRDWEKKVHETPSQPKAGHGGISLSFLSNRRTTVHTSPGIKQDLITKITNTERLIE
jgi:hypothetical protein